MRPINLRRVFFLASVFSLTFVYIFLWLRMIHDPAQYTGTDFVPFYAASQIASNEGPGRVYDLNLQKKYEEQLIGFKFPVENVNIYVNPPFMIPLANLVFTPIFRNSLIFWEILMAFYFLTSSIILFSLMHNLFPLKDLLIFLLGLLFFFPAYKSLLIGQNSAILFLGACLWLYGLLKRKDGIAGLGLALMTVRPHIALPLALPFIFKRKVVFWWFLAGVVALALFSWLYSGMDGILGFIKLLTVSAEGINTTVKEKYMVNLIGVLIRLFPNSPLSFIHLVGWVAYLITIIGLCTLWIRSTEIQGKQIGLAILVITFTAPHLHMHDLVLWSIPLVIILLSAQNDHVLIRKLALVPWWLSMAILFCFFSPILESVIPYLILLFLISAVYFPEKILSLSITEKGSIS